MDLWRIKRWQWGVAAIFLGLFLAYQRWQALATPDPRRAAIPSEELEHLLRGTIEDRPQLSDIVVHPTPNGYRLLATESQFNELIYSSTNIYMDVPRRFRPQDKVHPPDEELAFTDYLRWAAAQFPHVHYRYIWWDEPGWLFGGYAIIAGLIGAGVWPVALNLLAGEHAFSDRGAKSTYDLSRFRSESPPGEKASTTVDEAALAATITALQSQLANSATVNTAAAIPKATITPRLSTLTDSQRTHEADDLRIVPAKHFGGAFYPTELHPDSIEGRTTPPAQ